MASAPTRWWLPEQLLPRLTRLHQQSRARLRRILIVARCILVIALMMEEIVREMGCAESGIAGTLGMNRVCSWRSVTSMKTLVLDVNLDGEYNPETVYLPDRDGRPICLRDGLR